MSLNGNQYSPAPGILAPLAAAFALAAVPLKAQTPAAPPVWWKTTGAVNSSKTPNDQAVAAVGQAMFMARKARENMAAVYGAVYLNGQYGCGEGIERIFRAHQRALNADATGTVNHRGLKIGQLKYISAPFWKRLQELGAPGIPAAPASPYPWDRPLPGGQTPPAPQPQALATLGQMKMAFSFLMENAGGNYQNRLTLEPALAEPQTAHAYVHQKFASGQSGGKYATSAVWYVDGVEVSGADLESGSQTSAYGQVGYGVNGVAALEGRFFRLPAVPDRETGPASLSLSFPMPGAGGSVPDEDHSGHLYIQYRWRAFPDVVEEELYDPEANWRKAAGALVFLEESGAQRYPKGVIGWQRSSAAAGSGRFEVGGFDLAVPVWGVKWAGHTPGALADFPSDAVFNLRSRAGLAAGFPAAGVSGPGWRTTTVRIQLGVEGPDAMDIWLDGRPLGRSYAGYVDSSGEPSIPSTAFANPVFLKDRLSLQWNGLRNAPFDLGSIYIGWKNPLFQFNFRGDSAPDDGDPDHDGIPVGGSWPQYPLGAKPGWAPWIWTGQGGYPGMFNEEWEMDGDGTAQIFDRGFRMEEEGIRGKDWRQQWYPGRFREFDKKDISRFLQSMARPEPTLPMPYVVTPGGPQDSSDAIRPNPAFDSFGTVWGWEERIDRDRDGLPDNWEQFYGVMADNGQSDSDGDGISNADEYRHNLDPSGGAPASADVDQDGLSNDWELQHGYNPFDGVNQSGEDPDRDGLTNAQEAGLGTDPLAAADPGPASPGAPSGLRAGAAPGRYGAWVAGGSTPPPPLTAGSGLNRWIPGAAEDDPDKDDDGVPDDQDAVPYDPSLAFARVPESQYIVIPLTGADGVEEKGVPVAINNLGHILLAPEPPQGGWAAWPGSAGTSSLRAPKLWQRPGQAALPVPLPGTPGVAGVSAVPLPELAQEHYTAMWDHADARNRDTLDLDLAEDADIVLAHALLKYTGEGTVPAPVGQVMDRVPDLNGRHAFIWNSATGTGACLPWEPAVSLGRSSVERFLEGRSDHQETIAARLLFDGKAAGSGLRVRQRLLNASENKESDEWFYDFSWRNLGFAPELFLEVAGGTRSYLNQPPGGPAAEPENFQLDLHGIKGSRTVFHSWKRGAILEEGSDGTDRPFWETSSAQLSGEQGLALSRRGGWQRSRDRFYTPYVWTAQPAKSRLRKYQGGNPTALNDFPEFYDRPWPIAETGEGEPPLYPPVTTGPLIIGPPGCYWARSAATALQTGAGDGEFIPGWLYSHPGTESTTDGSGSAGRVPFEISETARINNQGIIICEDRLWRNGAGHNIADLVSSGPDYSDFELRDINDSGVIAATVLSASRNDRIPVMLVPVEMVAHPVLADGSISPDSSPVRTSLPSPVVNVANLQISNVRVDSSGLLIGDITLSGNVTSQVCDTIKGSDGQIDSLDFYANGDGEAFSSINVIVSKQENGPVGKPYPYSGSFSNIVISAVPLKEGVNTFQINAQDKIYGTAGYSRWSASVAVILPDSDTVSASSFSMTVSMIPDAALAEIDHVFLTYNAGSQSAANQNFSRDTGFAGDRFIATIGGQPHILELEESSVPSSSVKDTLNAVLRIGGTSSPGYRISLLESQTGSGSFQGSYQGYPMTGSANPVTLQHHGELARTNGGEFYSYALEFRVPNGIPLVAEPFITMGAQAFKLRTHAESGLLLVQHPQDPNKPVVASFCHTQPSSPPKSEEEQEIINSLQHAGFGRGLAVGVKYGAKSMVIGTKDVIVGTGERFVQNAVLLGVWITMGIGHTVFGVEYSENDKLIVISEEIIKFNNEDLETAASVVEALKPLGELALDNFEVLGDLEIALLTGDFDALGKTWARGGEVNETVLSFAAEAIADTLVEFQDSPPGVRGYYVGRVIFEAGMILIPVSKGKQLAQMTKSEFLTQLSSKLSAGAKVKSGLLLNRLLTTRMCFVAGTLILCELDNTIVQIPIEQIERYSISHPELKVWSKNQTTGEEAWKRPTAFFVTRPDILIHLYIDSDDDGLPDETISGTAPHPFWVKEKGVFVSMEDLQPGDTLSLACGGCATVKKTVREYVHQGETLTTYNFEVADFHTYFAGRSGVWVHNSGKTCEDVFAIWLKIFDKEAGVAKAYQRLRKLTPKMTQEMKEKVVWGMVQEGGEIDQLREAGKLSQKFIDLGMEDGKFDPREAFTADRFEFQKSKTLTRGPDGGADFIEQLSGGAHAIGTPKGPFLQNTTNGKEVKV